MTLDTAIGQVHRTGPATVIRHGHQFWQKQQVAAL
jgi:hypothetical protein